MQTLYPFKFSPIFKSKIWGGEKIKEVLNLDTAGLANCGEVWLVSGVEGNPSIVSNGYLAGNELNELVEVFMGDLVGDKVYDQFGDVFPVLVKIIDSNDWLSIQVHPDDALAQKRGLDSGKTEMWYVMQADKNAELICGFNCKMDRETYLKHLNEKSLKDVMNFEKVVKGDVFFIPAGRVHALGPGTLIAEIQQTSDTTYRIYDWDRVDEAGQLRELHTEEAIDAIDFATHSQYKTFYKQAVNRTENIVKSPFFTTNAMRLTHNLSKDYTELDSFAILMCTEGAFHLKWNEQLFHVTMGEAILIPAITQFIELIPIGMAHLLEVVIE